jgi:hypothetical protein
MPPLSFAWSSLVDDGTLNVADPIGLLGWLFLGERVFPSWLLLQWQQCDVDDDREEPALPACVYPLEACR